MKNENNELLFTDTEMAVVRGICKQIWEELGDDRRAKNKFAEHLFDISVAKTNNATAITSTTCRLPEVVSYEIQQRVDQKQRRRDLRKVHLKAKTLAQYCTNVTAYKVLSLSEAA